MYLYESMKDRVWIPGTHVKLILSFVAPHVTPALKDRSRDRRIPGVQWPSSLAKFVTLRLFSERTCFKIQGGGMMDEDTRYWPLIPTCKCMSQHRCTNMSTYIYIWKIIEQCSLISATDLIDIESKIKIAIGHGWCWKQRLRAMLWVTSQLNRSKKSWDTMVTIVSIDSV